MYVNPITLYAVPCSIGFENMMYAVNESDGGVSVCVHLMCPENRTNMVHVEVFRDMDFVHDNLAREFIVHE